MAKINGNEIRPGMVVKFENGLWSAVKTMAVKPGKGPAYNQVELKNLLDGRKLNQRFGSDERVERVTLEQKKFQHLYQEGNHFIFMDQETYDQISIGADFLGDKAIFLKEGMIVVVELHDETPIGFHLPSQVTLGVVEADPVIRGQTASASYKSAKLENGLHVMVPPFVSSGDRIIVNTEGRTYVSRAEG